MHVIHRQLPQSGMAGQKILFMQPGSCGQSKAHRLLLHITEDLAALSNKQAVARRNRAVVDMGCWEPDSVVSGRSLLQKTLHRLSPCPSHGFRWFRT